MNGRDRPTKPTKPSDADRICAQIKLAGELIAGAIRDLALAVRENSDAETQRKIDAATKRLRKQGDALDGMTPGANS